jgi:UDP-glucose 4-epimerase
MKVAVIGATGNIGTALVDLLAADDEVHDIVAFARRPPARSWPKTTFVALDVTTGDLAPHLAGAGSVFHLAWAFQPTRRPAATWAVNVGGTARSLDAAATAGVRNFICASSVGAYSPGPDREVAEDWPTDGLVTAGYGREKAYIERLLDLAEARHPQMRIVRMRPGFIFQRASGPQQRRLFAGRFVPTALLAPGALPVLPFPQGLRLQALHASDAARAFALAMKSGAQGAFNLASEPVVDGAALARLMGTRLLPVPPSFARAAMRAAWAAHLVPVEPGLLDLALALPLMRTDRARQELGWSPVVPATDAIAEALAGMREGAGGGTAPLAPGSRQGRRRAAASGAGGRQ